ncbi:hypothetical protein NRB20_20270 [Nocardia sp. RB20]|uniref:Transposase n=1 Tax=Nocardia macrotermitis TaxID=2585198 RepID=A0A7K0CZN9_9NOCA|nr:hypothetical protein [Nocardia macrotermitis]
MVAPQKCSEGELKARAARLSREVDPQSTIGKLAEQLGVCHEGVRNLIRYADADVREREDRPTTSGEVY